jgi:hypothetical protein
MFLSSPGTSGLHLPHEVVQARREWVVGVAISRAEVAHVE